MKGWIFKRNKGTRVIALMLAMIMMSAPFFAHAGLKGDSKAEEADTKKSYTMDITLTTDVKAEKVRITENAGNYMIGYVNSDSKVETQIPIKTSTYYFDSDYISVTINSVQNDINFGEVTDTSGKTLTVNFDNRIFYSVGLDGNKDELAGDKKITITKTNTTDEIYFWLIPEIKDNNVPSTTYQTTYQPIYCLQFVEKNIDAETITFKYDNKDIEDNKYYKSAILNYNSASVSDINIGNVYFGYIDESDGSFTSLTSGTSVNTTGKYTPCIRYGFSEADKDVIKDIYGTPVMIDAAAPNVSVSLISKNKYGNDIEEEITELNATKYVKNNNYTIKIVADDVDGSGIDTIETDPNISVNYALAVTRNPVAIDGKKATFEFSVNSSNNQQVFCDYTIYDLAGNYSEHGTLTINVDNDPPTISEIHATVHNDESGNDGNNIEGTDLYYNKDCDSLTLKAKVTDAKALDKVYLYYKKKNDISYPEESIELSNDGNNGYYHVFDDDDNYTFESGEYTFCFKAIDKAGNEITSEKDFRVDRNPPEGGTSVYYYRQKDEEEWTEWGTNSHGKYVFNTALMDEGKIEYSVVVTATDDFSGVDKYTLEKGTGSIDEELDEELDEDGFKVRYTFKTTDLTDLEDEDHLVEISFTDKAGNKTINDENYILKKDEIEIAGTDIEILSGSLKIYETEHPENTLDLKALTDKNGNINAMINKSYTISVEAVSGYEITGASLSAVLWGDEDDEDEDDAPSLTIGGTCGENKFDIEEGKLKSVVTFEAPGNEILGQKNEKLRNIKLTVSDNRSDLNANTATKTIGQILYDISRPRLESTNADNEWHKDFKPLKCTIVSKAYMVEEGLPDVESGLSWYNYKITNSKNDMESEYIEGGLAGTDGIGARIDDVPESLTPSGTIITFNAEDRAGNSIYDEANANRVVVKVDKTKPEIKGLSVNESVNHQVPYGGQPVIKAVAYDNLTLDEVVVEVVYPDGTTRGKTNTINKDANGSEGITETTDYTIEKVEDEVLDGEYTVRTYALDKAGRQSDSQTTTFRIDNSKPVVTARVIAGTASPKTVAPYYYKDNVSVELTYQDNNMSSSGVSLTDNGNAIGGISWAPVDGVSGKYRAVIAVTAEGSHNITINATDVTGNTAEPKSIAFVIDKTLPNVTAYVNGTTVYNDSMGNLMLTGTTTVSMDVSDMTRDAEDNYVQIQKHVPNEPAPNPAYIKTSNTNMTFNDEADYVVNFYAVDRANNTSATKAVRFRIDRTAPELRISAGGTSASATNVTFTMREAFWWDANASLTIYRKSGDGAKEELYKTVSFNPSAYQTSVSEFLSDTGVYRFEFEARDKVGHRSQLSQTLTIDLDAPVVVLKGVNDYDMTDGAVQFSVEITDAFYSSKKVSISGTRTDMDGKAYKLDFGAFLQSINPTTISKTFNESGVYDITLVTSDIVGNEHSENIHFTIDNAAPVIGDLSKYDGKIFKSFSWDEDLDELVSDLTVCDVQMFLNGSEYDGSSDIEDGSYVLLIVATDEMGHRTEKEVRFELDTKAPVFIVTGVEDKEVKNEDYIINISLQLDEDTLSSVTLNGTNISVRDNTATINVTEKGEYALVLKAYDAAGNEAEETITFTYGEEKSLWWIWIIIACGIILLGTIIIIIAKKKKNDEQ